MTIRPNPEFLLTCVLLGTACTAERDAPVELAQNPVTSQTVVTREPTEGGAYQGNPDFVRCDQTAITDPQLAIYANRVSTGKALARRVAASQGFRDCMTAAMTTGTVIAADNNRTYGPYCIANQTGCGAFTGDKTDPYNPTNRGATDQAVTGMQLARLLAMAEAPHDQVLICQATAGGAGGYTMSINDATAIRHEESGDREVTFVSVADMLGVVNDPNPRLAANYLGHFLLHEAVHFHGYEHGVGTGTEYPKQGIGIISGCMNQVLANSVSCPNVASCPAVEDRIARWGSTDCDCVPDPRASRTWKSRTLTSAYVAADDAGFGYYIQPGGNVTRVGDGTTSTTVYSSTLFGAATGIFAGGDRVFIQTSNGNLYRREVGTNAWTNLGQGGLQFVVDGVGNGYRRSAGSVDMVGRFANSFTTIGGPAARLLAGGSSLYATSPADGSVYQYNRVPHSWAFVGGAGRDFAVDSYGVLYGLSPDGATLWRKTGSGSTSGWTQVPIAIGGLANRIVAGNRVYRLDTTGRVHQLDLVGGWALVAGSSSSPIVDFSAGGDAFWAQHGSTAGNWVRYTLR
jgi:hypothetical protein